MIETVGMEFGNFEAKLSLDNPVGDYARLSNEKLKAVVIMPHEVLAECWRKISTAARDAIWELLFPEDGNIQLEKATELLKLLKEDACFYQAADYNSWIVLVRDELLKRKMLDFWKNVIVRKELGPCWARDSDLYDDTDDPEPAKFYEYAGCEAPWLKELKAQTSSENRADMLPFGLLSAGAFSKDAKPLKTLSKETPLEDYKYNMESLADSSDEDDDEAYKQIFSEARDMVWHLLFSESTLTAENFEKAAGLLEEYKRDACFYSPWEYNDWIRKVKNEVIKRKYVDFWNGVVVEKELGLCWAADSDYFDDMDDNEPLQFLKLPEELVEEHNK